VITRCQTRHIAHLLLRRSGYLPDKPTERNDDMPLQYLHTMVRVTDLEKSIAFYELLGLKETRRFDNEGGRFTLIFMAPPGQKICRLI
jgi:hypothetical protein